MFEVSIPYSFPLPHESLRWFHPARVLALDLTPLHVFAAKTSPTRLTNPFVTYSSSFILQYASIMPTFRRQIYGHLLIKANISAKIWLIPQKRHSSEIIDWAQVMNSLGSIDDFSYKGYITTFDVVIVRLEKVSGDGVQLVSALQTEDGRYQSPCYL